VGGKNSKELIGDSSLKGPHIKKRRKTSLLTSREDWGEGELLYHTGGKGPGIKRGSLGSEKDASTESSSGGYTVFQRRTPRKRIDRRIRQ